MKPQPPRTPEIFILMVDIARILVTVETLRVRNSGRYHAPRGIYDIKAAIRNRDRMNARDQPPLPPPLSECSPPVHLSNANFQRAAINPVDKRELALAPFRRLPRDSIALVIAERTPTCHFTLAKGTCGSRTRFPMVQTSKV